MNVRYVRFGSDDLRHILDDEKHCFRIAVGTQDISRGEMTDAGLVVERDGQEEREVIQPPYSKGDILAIKETWAEIDGKYVYRAGGETPNGRLLMNWRASTQMPKEAARTFIKITDVSFERLWDISLADISGEGIWLPGTLSPEYAFAMKWNDGMSERKRQKIGWDHNPWVWVFRFERTTM